MAQFNPAARSMLRHVTAVAALAVLMTTGRSSGQQEAPADSAPATPPPPARILDQLRARDPERHLRGFADWMQWRSDLPREGREAALSFLCDARWMPALGSVAIYEMDSPKSRLQAYKALERIGGRRVFPYFLWGINVANEGSVFLVFESTTNRLANKARKFFAAQGDPTVLEYLPEWEWMVVRQAIENRWRDRVGPNESFVPLSEEKFVSDLRHRDPAKRRLAVRAITVNRRAFRGRTCGALHPLLNDPDPGVVERVVRAMTLISCPKSRGRLKDLTEDASLSVSTRRMCLKAVVKCRTAPDWTAEWILEALPSWPSEMDDGAAEALRKLRPSKKPDQERYDELLERAARDADDDRIRSVLARARKG